jgi:hypothetical protein
MAILYLYINNKEIIEHDKDKNKIFIGNKMHEFCRSTDQFYLYNSIFNFQELVDFNNRASRSIVDKMHKVFFPYVDQFHRWSFTRTVNIDIMYHQFNQEIHRWHYFLHKNRINKIYFYEDPHHAFDLVLYHVAILLDIEIHIFSTINIGYRSYIKNRIEDDLSCAKTVSITENIVSTLKVSIQHTGVILQKPVKYVFFNIVKKKFNNVIEKVEFYKKNTTILPLYRSFVLIYIQQRVFFIRAYIGRVLYIYKFNKSALRSVTVGESDIIFYKHYFPERTTNPLSYPYLSQEECIDILLQLNNKLIIKEHPVSLNTKNSHRDRCAQKVSHINKYLKSNIPLITNNTLEEHLVATMNGTIGLEMAIKGFKVICFGNPWYGFLPNVHIYQDYNSLVEFIDAPVENNKNSIERELLDMINLKTADFRVDNKYDKNQSINKLTCEEYLASYKEDNI